MSADNFIALQRRGGTYHVWMAFASDPEPHIPFGDSRRKFITEAEARAYAIELCEEGVEYGIIHLDAVSAWEDARQRMASIKYYFI